MGMTKRRFFTISGTALATTALAGCTGDEGEPDTEEESGTEDETTDESDTDDGEPSFELQRYDIQPRIITVDDELTATATVENTGDGPGAASVTFNFDVSQETGETAELEPGEAEQVVVDIEPPLIDPDQYDMTIELEGEQVVTSPISLFETIEEPGYYGAVISENDIDLSSAQVRIGVTLDGERMGSDRFSIDEAHQFRAPAPGETGESLRITFISDTHGESDGIPAVFALTDSHTVSDSIELLGPYEIPEAYRTEIQLVDGSGNPIPDFDLSVRPSNGSGTRFTTNGDGYMIARDASETGVNLPSRDESDIRIDASLEGEPPEVFGEVFGSEDGEEFVFEVTDPDRFN